MESTTGDDNQGKSLVNEPVARQRDDDRHDAGALIFASAGTDRAEAADRIIRLVPHAQCGTSGEKTAPLSVGGLVRKGRPWATKAV
jgi:hypothetical protein